MHFPQVPSLFILAVTFWAAPRGAKGLVSERNVLVVSKPAVASVNAQSTNKVGHVLGSPGSCPDNYLACTDDRLSGQCCPEGGRCCQPGRSPDRSLNSRSMIRVLV